MQVINDAGDNLGIVSRQEALRMAAEAELDLVLLAPMGKDGVPVTKIMDFGKVIYAKKKKMSESKKHQKTIQIKEVKIRPGIGEHDFLTKMKQAVQFLNDGKRLKVTLSFRGREIATRDERGSFLFEKILQYMTEQGLTNIIQEKDSKAGGIWSRIYFLKR